MPTFLYVLGDADRVRDGIDQRLLQGRLDDLKAFSTALTTAVAQLLHAFEAEMEAEVVMAGGDDVLLRVNGAKYSLPKNREVASRFLDATGCTMSFGVSDTLAGAYINLRRAKAERTGICLDAVRV